MPPAVTRGCVGFIAAALSVVIFHQGVIELLHLAGIAGPAWSLRPVPPWGVPRLADLCFWGGLYGILYGLAAPAIRLPLWFSGLLLGCLAAAVFWFVVAPIKGMPFAADWQAADWGRALLINGVWGIGVGLIFPLLLPRPRLRAGRLRR